MNLSAIRLIAIAAGLMVFNAYSASPPTPKLTKSDTPLIDLGGEMGGSLPSRTTSKPQYKPAPKKVYTPSNRYEAPKTEMPSEKMAVAPKMPADSLDDEFGSWGYSGKEGPRYWAELSDKNLQCKNGKNQSPIDLRDNHALGTSGMPELEIRYREVPLKIVNTGKTLKVNYPLGSYAKVGSKRYELMHYEFHTPSEHQKEGFNYPMEVQFVHRDGDGNHAIIGVIFQEGEENEHLQVLLDNLPKEINKQEIRRGETLSPVMFFPGDTKFYKYTGSLTTPPCSEGVYWMIFKQPIEASAEQIQQMNEVMGDNSRPIQAINARSLLKSWTERNLAQEPLMYEFF